MITITSADNLLSLISNIHKTGYKSIPNNDQYMIEANISCRYFFSTTDSITLNALWSLAHIALLDDNELLQKIFNSGVCQEILNNGKFFQGKLLPPSLKLLGNLMTGSNEITDEFLKLDIMTLLKSSSIAEYAMLRREALWCISNVIIGSKTNIKMIINTDAIDCIIKSTRDNYREVTYEGALCLLLLAQGCDLDDATKLIKRDIFDVIIPLMTHEDVKIVMNTLITLTAILNQGETFKGISNNQVNLFVECFIKSGGADVLENSQYHNNSNVSSLATEIIMTYFPTDN
jgi:importin subunit alpha-2